MVVPVELLVFVFSASVTPGPNNIMLTTSGANFGFVRTIPHLFGISIGFWVMVIVVGLGMANLLGEYPAILSTLSWIGMAYLTYLAWRIVSTHSRAQGTAKAARPLSFFAAAAFQCVNPKAWAVIVSVIAGFMSQGGTAIQQSLTIGAVFATANLCTGTMWIAFGASLSRYLESGNRRKWFNYVMATLMVGSFLWIII